MSPVSSRVRRTFCCCIPTRAGVIIIAILGILIGGAGSIWGIISLSRTNADWSSIDKVASSVQVVIYSLFFLIAVLGLWGAIGKRRGLVKTFFVMLTIHLFLNIAAGSLALYNYFKNTESSITQCVGDSDSDTTKNACRKGVQIFNGCMVGLYIFIWLLQIYGCLIVNDYSHQLEDEEYLKAKELQFNNSMSRA